jgi:hypothetical protein
MNIKMWQEKTLKKSSCCSQTVPQHKDSAMVNSTDPQAEPASLKLYVRLATQEDVEDIVDVIHRAFMHDPVLNYFGSVKKVRGNDKAMMYIASSPI